MKRSIFTTLCFLSAAFWLLFLTGCADRKEKTYRIGVSQCSGDYWRVKTDDDLRRELLFHDDAELEFRCADNDSRRQIDDIRYFMDNGFDLIIVSPNEADELTPVVSEAFNKGIPVVTFDRRINGDCFTAHMEVDNYELGRAVADYAGSIVRGPVNALEIQGPTSASPARLRHQGFTDAVAAAADKRVVASVYGNWDDGRSEVLTDSVLRVHPEINFIYAHTDHMGIGASRGARAAGRRDIPVVGIDGFPHVGIKAVKDSVLRATFLYPTEGERLLRIAMAILHGEPYDRINEIPPLSPIDIRNADIVVAQDSLLTGETTKINLLREKLDDYWQRYSNQRMLLYAALTIAVLMAGILFLLIRTVITGRRHRATLISKNAQLEEEKRHQQELLDRMKDVTQSKLMFFTNVSHDLRTPLTLIAGPVDQVADADYLTPRHKSLMQVASKNVRILRRLIDQILDFRKYENGKIDLHLRETDLPAQLQEWTAAFREMAKKRDIRLTTDISHDGPAEVAIDVEKMERVFFNLMSNAFKHTPDNGRIDVIYRSDGHSVSFAVRDNGEGIAADEQAKIFDRFYQVDKITSKGSGIGLALTKAFIELHGGTITVASEKGRGSEFTVTLPLRHCKDAGCAQAVAPRFSDADIALELSPVRREAADFDQERPVVLVVDDNKDILTLVSDLLGDSYNVLTAPDGQQGLKAAVKYVPDLVISDVMMPVMDGMEMVRRMKNEISTSHIPVLMLTACTLDEQRIEGYDNGADGYLSKPFSGDVLAARCRNLLDGRRRIKELYSRGGAAEAAPRKAAPKADPAARIAPNDVENDFYTRFMDIVEARLADSGLSVDDIAAQMGLSQSQFTRKIKALTNYTPVEIIRTLRLQRAKTMLCSTDRTVSEIAFAVGFTSLAYFSKCYKQAFGESPSEVRGRK